MDLYTTILQLSSILHDKLSTLTNLNILSAIKELSAVPSHPYERLKYNLFGKDYSFPTIENIEIPTDFDPGTYLCQLTAISDKTNQMGLCALSSMDNFTPTLFETPTIVDQDFLKRNLEFVEVVKSININDIQTKPVELMQKLTSFYIKNCQIT